MYLETKIWMQSNDVGIMNCIYYFPNGCDFMGLKILFYSDAIF